MIGMAAILVASQWDCTSPLAVGTGADVHAPVRMSLTFAADGVAMAEGFAQTDSTLTAFDWKGHWVPHEDQIAMIGTKTVLAERRAGTEIRLLSQRIQSDVIILNMIHNTNDVSLLRCLPERY
ncbi:hypothetical protein [uncultured Tateyamaria sp.]|uniref:hypothetical protein n=1 Tax=uncultured Tateyamaria sp. TaxID=455651 RepID=UPI00260638AC|nr:hypothetical protein [uncultured Tateyamaria sp.]